MFSLQHYPNILDLEIIFFFSFQLALILWLLQVETLLGTWDACMESCILEQLGGEVEGAQAPEALTPVGQAEEELSQGNLCWA